MCVMRGMEETSWLRCHQLLFTFVLYDVLLCGLVISKKRKEKNIIFALHAGTSEIVTARATFFFFLL